MQRIYEIRNRYGVPIIVSLFLALTLLSPIEAVVLASGPLHAPAGPLHVLLLLALFLGCLGLAATLWGRWLARPPGVVAIPGGRPARRI